MEQLRRLRGLAWALLQWLGDWYVARQLSRASATYGTFALSSACCRGCTWPPR
ncbi:MAG TPA: hypothetical protein VI751_13830 [Actinomycetota bacterium]|jgi:hypothetical protein